MARIVTDDDGIVWRESFDDWLGYTQFTVVIIMCGWCVGGEWTVQRSLSFKYISSGRNGRTDALANMPRAVNVLRNAATTAAAAEVVKRG